MNYYDVLGVSSNSSDEEISCAYRSMLLAFSTEVNYDDSSFADEKISQIIEAYNILKNIDTRRKYDDFILQGARFKYEHEACCEEQQYEKKTGDRSTSVQPSKFHNESILWFNFYTYVCLPLFLTHAVKLVYTEAILIFNGSVKLTIFSIFNLLFYLTFLTIEILYLLSAVYTVINIRNFTNKSFYSNMLLLVLFPVLFTTIFYNVDVEKYIFYCFAIVMLISFPNIVYFFKRRHKFENISNNDILHKHSSKIFPFALILWIILFSFKFFISN